MWKLKNSSRQQSQRLLNSPKVKIWKHFPSSHGNSRIRLLLSLSSLRCTRSPMSGGKVSMKLLEASRCSRLVSAPISLGKCDNLLLSRYNAVNHWTFHNWELRFWTQPARTRKMHTIFETLMLTLPCWSRIAGLESFFSN